MAEVKEIVSNLAKLLDTKLICFNELLYITKNQKEDIETNQGDNLQALADEKQAIINKVDTIDKAFAVQFDMMKKALNIKTLDEAPVLQHPELKVLKNRVESIMQLANEIMKLEKENNQKSNAIFEDIKNELKNIKRGKISLKAYEKPAINVDGVYLDKKK